MKKTSTGIFQLGIGICVIWLMMFHVCPAIIKAIPAYTRYGEAVDLQGLHAGSLFYSDIPFINEAELHIRNTVRFLPHGKQ